jgi:hypothetical protein
MDQPPQPEPIVYYDENDEECVERNEKEVFLDKLEEKFRATRDYCIDHQLPLFDHPDAFLNLVKLINL